MKVTKLKKGYRINLSDSEMSLLRSINDEGIVAYYEMHSSDLTALNHQKKEYLLKYKTIKEAGYN